MRVAVNGSPLPVDALKTVAISINAIISDFQMAMTSHHSGGMFAMAPATWAQCQALVNEKVQKHGANKENQPGIEQTPPPGGASVSQGAHTSSGGSAYSGSNPAFGLLKWSGPCNSKPPFPPGFSSKNGRSVKSCRDFCFDGSSCPYKDCKYGHPRNTGKFSNATIAKLCQWVDNNNNISWARRPPSVNQSRATDPPLATAPPPPGN